MRYLGVAVAMMIFVACASEWKRTPILGGYQAMIMNSRESYVASSSRELLLGPRIESMGIAPPFIVVNCGEVNVVENGFANTVGFNVIDTEATTITKNLTETEAARLLKSRGVAMPEMRDFSLFLN